MKVKALIKELAECDPNAEVIVASDSEGNNYSQLQTVCVGNKLRYLKQDYEISLLSQDDVDEDVEAYEKDYKKAKPAIVLFP